MKKSLLILLGLILIYANAIAGGGWATSAVSITINNGTPYQYPMDLEEGWTDGSWFFNSPIDTYDFGTPVSLILNGASGNAWTDDYPGYNSTSFILYYRVYKSGATPGSWSQIALDNLDYYNGNNYIYDKSNAGIDIKVLATVPGTNVYVLELTMSKNQIFTGGNWISMIPGGQGVGYSSTNTGYKATFTKTVSAGSAPAVTGISPTSGPTTGGTSVTITGTDLTAATAVKFGSTSATSYTVNSATQITATSPAGSAGTVDITVTTTGGTSATSSADQFNYVAAPNITAISPTSGPTAGGTPVVITGTNFTGTTAVKFGSTNATSYTVNSATQITATSPAGPAGTVDVTVATVGGTSVTSSADRFTTSVQAPTESFYEQITLPYAPTDSVDMSSSTLAPTIYYPCFINSLPSKGYKVTLLTSGTITLSALSKTISTVNSTFVVSTVLDASSYTYKTFGNGTTATLTPGTYYIFLLTNQKYGKFKVNLTSTAPTGILPTIISISPTSGPTAGGTSVTITGTDLTAATAVKFGSTSATSYTVNSATQITATSPAGSAGAVDITVSTTVGTSATSNADQFTYSIAPTVTTQEVSSITIATATGNGNITSLGVPYPTAYGVCWNTTGTPTTSDSKVNNGAASATGAFTVSITGLTAKTTYHVRAFATNSTGTTYGAEVTFTTLTAGTWIGVTNSDWTDASNWAGGTVPTSTTDVTIPNAGITYLPMIFSTGKADCNNLTSDNGALEIISSASGTGSLIIHGSATCKVWTDVYLTGNQWHMVAPPSDETDISSFISNNYDISSAVNGAITTYSIAGFNEGSNAWNSYFTNSTYGTFSLGKGYTMHTDNDGHAIFYGPIVSGTKNISLTKTGEGWNSIGNPYTSAIDINATASNSSFLYLNTIANTSILDSNYSAIYLWDAGTSQYNAFSNAILKFTSKSFSQNYAAQGDAFFVKAAANGASVSFTKNMQSHQNTIPASAKTSWPAICIKVTNNSNTASTVVAFNNAMTKGLDVGYDAGLLKGTSGLNLGSSLVSSNGTNFAIQCLPDTYDNMTVPLSVECSNGGMITFSAENVSLPIACYAILEDNVTGTLTDFKVGQTYAISVAAGSVLTNRFFLHISEIVPPTVTAVSPAGGSSAGGTSVTVTGTNFIGASAVMFGAASATGVFVVSDTRITATVPAGTGTADVTVKTAGGTSTTVTAGQYTYLDPPGVTTQDIVNINATTAIGNGNITSLGSTNPTQYGVVWSTSANPAVILTTKTTQGDAAVTGAFTSLITGLVENTTYYVKAYATNIVGTSYGDEKSFTTLSSCNNPVSGGIIGSGQSGCSPFDPAEITGSELPAGNTGRLEYQWESSADSITFVSIYEPTSPVYNPDTLTSTTFYRRLSRVDCKSDWTGAAVSNVVKIKVDPIPVTPEITLAGNLLTSNANTGNQWYLEGVAIEGATGKEYTAVADGIYTVIVTLSGCSSATSNSKLFLPATVNDFEVSHSFDVYPNPGKGQFNIKVMSVKPAELTIEVFNNIGVPIWKQEKASINGMCVIPVNLGVVPNGVYFVSLRNTTAIMTRKIVIMK